MAGKTELVERIAFETGMPKAHAARAVEVTLDALVEWLRSGDRISLPGFGSFYTSDRPGREVRNPRTGEMLQVAPSRTVRFRPGKELKAAVKP